MPINEEQRALIAAEWRMRKGYSIQTNDIHEVSEEERPQITLPAPIDNVYARDSRAIFNTLLNGKSLPRRIVTGYALSVLLHPSNALLYAIQTEVQIRLDALLDAIEKMPTPLTDDEQTWVNCQLNNILSYTAFFQYAEGSTIRVPVFDGETYRPVDYTVDHINMTSTYVSSPYRAYGLHPDPKKNPDAPSQLLFMGTTFPGSNGFLWTLMADVFPLTSVGTLLSFLGSKTLRQWMSKQGKVITHGQSLGGSLAINTALKYPEQVEAFALVPAGHYQRDESLTVNNVTVIYGGSDPVSILGQMPKGAKYIYALPEGSPSKGILGLSGALKSHALGLACHPKTRLFRVDNDHMLQGGRSRHLINFLHFLSWTIVFPVVLTAILINTTFRLIGKGLKHVGTAFQKGANNILESIPKVGYLHPSYKLPLFLGLILKTFGNILYIIGSTLSADSIRPVFKAPPRMHSPQPTDTATVSEVIGDDEESMSSLDHVVIDMPHTPVVTSLPGYVAHCLNEKPDDALTDNVENYSDSQASRPVMP